MVSYKTDTVARVQRVLETEEPMCQILKIRDVAGKPGCPEKVKELPDFPDEPVPSGTRVYEDFYDGRIFEICVLRG